MLITNIYITHSSNHKKSRQISLSLSLSPRFIFFSRYDDDDSFQHSHFPLFFYYLTTAAAAATCWLQHNKHTHHITHIRNLITSLSLSLSPRFLRHDHDHKYSGKKPHRKNARVRFVYKNGIKVTSSKFSTTLKPGDCVTLNSNTSVRSAGPSFRTFFPLLTARSSLGNQHDSKYDE